jgi:hypothetical protein
MGVQLSCTGEGGVRSTCKYPSQPFSIHTYLHTLYFHMPVILGPVDPSDEGMMILYSAEKYQMTYLHIPKDLNLQHQCEELKFCKRYLQFYTQ